MRRHPSARRRGKLPTGARIDKCHCLRSYWHVRWASVAAPVTPPRWPVFRPCIDSRRMRGVPETMRAAAIDRFGGPEVLTVRTVPVPEPDSGEVLIAVHTAGVGSWDAEMRAGWWPEGRPRFSVILGSDGSGQLAAVGSRVRRLKRGDRVYAYSFAAPKGGFYASTLQSRRKRQRAYRNGSVRR